jgi:hypothetical protein
MTVSPSACTVFGNGSYIGNCPTNPTLRSFFSTSPVVMDIFYGLIVASFVLGALLIITKYREKPLGRFLEGWTGLIGIGRLRGLPSQVGKITPISDKVGFFDAGRGKGKMRGYVSLMPDSVFSLGAKDGGASFTLVDLDKRSTIAPDVLEWAYTQFSQFAKSHDWPSFCFNFKLFEMQQIEQAKAKLVQFPPVNTEAWKALPKEAIEEYRRLETFASMPDPDPIMRLKLQAMIRGDKQYYTVETDAKGKEVKVKHELAPLEIVSMVRSITSEIENVAGPLADSVYFGKTIPAQHIAGILKGMPTIQHLTAVAADMEEALRSKIKNGWTQYVPLAVIGGIIAGGILLMGLVIK